MTNVALIFPGQGAQAVGMGKEFYEASPQAKAIFDEANNVIPGLTDVIFNGPQEKLTSTAFCQPAIFTYSVAALKALEVHPKYKNISPKFVCGLSLGECSAVVASGATSFEAFLKIVERRAAFMEEATQLNKGTMAAVIGLEKEKIVAICQEIGAQVANFNAPDQIVITGEVDKVLAASEKIKEAGAKRVIPLEVSGAFHSTLMQPATPKFAKELSTLSIQKPLVPIISNVDAKPTDDPEIIRANLAKQITSSVLWVDTIQFIAAQGVTHFIEIGPGTVLKGLIRKINKDLNVYNIQQPQDIEALPF
ncbi:MAG: ACP S-malonyltransferase [Candidatus Omnitrophica bacterium]|nr:ACP S-malonyltransferase [Candidatus Omnitrophota bacterium]